LADQFSTLSRRDDYPIAWNNSRAQYMNVSRQASAIGAFKQQRSPEQVDKDLAAAGTLLAQQKELARHYQQIARQHGEFLEILISSELRQGPEWLRSTQILAAHAAAYAPENWPRADSVVSLPSELKDLAERHQRFAALDPADPILEADMIQELEKARGLSNQHKSLRERVARIQTRLVELQEVDRAARERLQFARNALGQIELLARSNAFLSEIASPEIAALKGKLEQQAAEIEQRQRGLVEEKSKALQVLVQQIEAAVSTWLERLNAEIEARKKTIADRLDVLGQIANLEERAVVEAQRLLSQDLPTSVAQRSKQRPVLSLEEALAQLKPRSDYWQSCIASIREIEDLERPVLETYDYAFHQYEETKEQLASAAQWVPTRRSWPPTSLSLEEELQEFNEIDTQWQAIESQPSRAITVVRQLSDLAGKLQALAERAGRKVERAEQEQTRIRDLEGDLDDLIRRWQALGQQVPQASAEIRKIGSETDRELDRLKRLYRQGALSYSQVLQSINSLCQDVQNSQITLEDGQILRLNGNQNTSTRRY
jgi:chromosome segregation ATPase